MSRKKKLNLAEVEVMAHPCSTCPFEGPHRSSLSPEAQAMYTNKIVRLESQHLCHTVNNEKLCRGGRNIMLKVMFAMKLIDEPTDEAYNTKRKEVLGF